MDNMCTIIPSTIGRIVWNPSVAEDLYADDSLLYVTDPFSNLVNYITNFSSYSLSISLQHVTVPSVVILQGRSGH